jgi:hypothetical protein
VWQKAVGEALAADEEDWRAVVRWRVGLEQDEVRGCLCQYPASLDDPTITLPLCEQSLGQCVAQSLADCAD